ncbi:MAG: CRISPR-associated endonuclease Cas2 [Deltaproteobacteria bacterium]|nr:MAG: CRISPR-associated endonuclease Cas2 [Deltaproteobacteria bacterium]
MFLVISYDIKDDNRRDRVCNELKNYGEHVQYSVFECTLDRAQIKELQTKLGRLIHKRQDSIRYYFLCKGCVEKAEIQGKRTPLWT